MSLEGYGNRVYILENKDPEKSGMDQVFARTCILNVC